MADTEALAVGGVVSEPVTVMGDDTALCTYRHPADYMRPGLHAYTAEEFGYVEQQHEEAAHRA